MSAPAVTPAAVQAVLGTSAMNAQILVAAQTDTPAATTGCYYCIGNVDAPGRSRWVAITNTDSAATQAAAILTALRA